MRYIITICLHLFYLRAYSALFIVFRTFRTFSAFRLTARLALSVVMLAAMLIAMPITARLRLLALSELFDIPRAHFPELALRRIIAAMLKMRTIYAIIDTFAARVLCTARHFPVGGTAILAVIFTFLFGDGVIPTLTQRITPQYSPRAQQTALRRAEPLYRLVCIRRAGGIKPTAPCRPRRYIPLIEPYQPQKYLFHSGYLFFDFLRLFCYCSAIYAFTAF